MTRLVPNLLSIALTVLILLAAAVGLWIVWQHYEEDPWTRDGVVQADVVPVSADVSGMVTQINVRDNQFVRTGDVLFTVDQDRYLASLEQAKAKVASAAADIDSAMADIAKDRATLANSKRDEARYVSLGSLVSKEDRDQRITKVQQDAATLAQDEAKLGQKNASLKEAQANQRTAEIDVERSTVRARVTGYVTNFGMRPGVYVNSGSKQFALLDVNSYYVLAYFEETKLHRFDLGSEARIELLGDNRPLFGHVDSMSAGITDRQKNPSDDLLPNITPTFSWIRLAQRIPVRIVIDSVPADLRLIAGRTATVWVSLTLRTAPSRREPASSFTPNTSPISRSSPLPDGRPRTIAEP